jgi:hypothetical protein
MLQTPQRRWRNTDAQLGQVSLNKILEKLLPPGKRIGLNARSISAREAPAEPVPVLSGSAQIGETHALQQNSLNAPGERLRRLPQQIGRSAARIRTRGQRLAVGQNPQQGKQLRPVLDLVDDYQLLQLAQRCVRLGESGKALGFLEIEVVERVKGNELLGKGGLSALTGPEKRDHTAAT